MAKVIIATAAGNQTLSEQREFILKQLTDLFGKPAERKVNKATGEASYAWMKSSVQLYFEANGKYGIFIQFRGEMQFDVPDLELDRVSYKVLAARLERYADRYVAAVQKEVDRLDKLKAKYQDMQYAFAQLKRKA